MTERQLISLVDTWQDRLNLNHWRISVRFGTPETEAALAECSPHHQYDTATIVLGPSATSWSAREASEVVVHELLHIHERDVWQATLVAKDYMPTPDWLQFEARQTKEREGLVDRLALAIVDLGGLP